jgi:hypothetical protein
MKTFLITSILIFGLVASNHGKPITDIYSIQDPAIEEEAYIDDIPFDTWEIASAALSDGDEVKMEEEPYIDDIPFDTRAIACKCLLRKMFEASGEANVSDIPFSTGEFLCEYLASKMREQYRNEANANDLPEDLNQIIITLKNGNKMNYTIIYPAKSAYPETIRLKDDAEHQVLIIPKASL